MLYAPVFMVFVVTESLNLYHCFPAKLTGNNILDHIGEHWLLYLASFAAQIHGKGKHKS